MALARAKRITGQSSFQRLYRTGKTLGSPLVALRLLSNDQPGLRVAVVIPAKVIARATRRNYLRRRLLHGLGPLLKRAPTNYGIDIVIQLRSGATNSTVAEIEASLSKLIKEANIV